MYGNQATSTTPAPGARAAAALLCLALIGVETAWLVRDIHATGFHNTIWRWLQLDLIDPRSVPTTTSITDVVLLVVLVAALAAARRPSAGGAFAAAGLAAVLFRLPGVWIFTADWTRGFPERGRLLATSIAFVAGGLLLALAAFARVPANGAGAGAASGAGSGGGARAAANRPARGPAIAAGVLLVLLAAETVGWQIYFVHTYGGRGYPPHLYRHGLFGDPTTLGALLAPPFAWAGWATVLFAVVAAFAAFRGAPAARPLAMVLGLRVALVGVVALDLWHEEKLLFAGKRLPGTLQAQQWTAVLEIVLGVALIALAVPRANRGPFAGLPPLPPARNPRWGPPQPYDAPPAPPRQPQQPPQSRQPPSAPRFPPNPPAGGFGPPPPGYPPSGPASPPGYPPGGPRT
ncbi:hypothetical protein [Actinacidiphila guanduensis]|uniref:Uncharacterized protein n=1 Tax=Actinacidiphila guanduensis TaxID=310781 RepID=A0A1H0A737_9ACTN|nr:hypothetical protein [Actinacidiphila guanduensis]SDN28803.1 hypothetical protein SAMN05216259_103421 [Actinacidiphila guanduensis]